MRTVIATDVRLLVKNGKYYYSSPFSTILKRYYEHFGKLSICGRVIVVDETPSLYEDVTYMIDRVVAVPSLVKVMMGFYDKEIHQIVTKCDLLICRCHGIIAHRAADIARRVGKVYYAEVIGCAWDAYWNHGIKGKIIAPYVFFKMKQTVYHANYALYVTSDFLQKRYPCKSESVGISDVLIENFDDKVLEKRIDKIGCKDYSKLTLMTTAAVNVRYKGQEFVIKAIPFLNKAGIRVRYLLVGGGDITYLQNVARKNGVEDQVEFAGRQPLKEVFSLLDEADIYIQPSLQEGLPRSVIEAMSRGCPAIGAKTAGIPELLSPECVVRRKSAKDIASAIVRIAKREKMEELAKRNFAEAKGYQDSVLNERREAHFLQIIAEVGKN